MAAPKVVAGLGTLMSATPAAETKAAPAAASSAPVAAAPEKKTVRFVRNIQPNYDLELADGTVVPFRRYVFTTSDEELIKKIQAVAKDHHIVS